jgi:serine/threonine protein kinase
VGPGTDIYSLGVVLWEMVMGRKPYDVGTFSSFDIQTKIVQEPLQGTGGVWDEVIAQATAKEPGRRFTECAAFHGAIQLVRQGNTYHHAQTANEGASSDKTVIAERKTRNVDGQTIAGGKNPRSLSPIPSYRPATGWVFAIYSCLMLIGIGMCVYGATNYDENVDTTENYDENVDTTDFQVICSPIKRVPVSWIDDGQCDCDNCVDENTTYFICYDGNMIPEDWVNDDYCDCDDCSDEEISPDNPDG